MKITVYLPGGEGRALAQYICAQLEETPLANDAVAVISEYHADMIETAGFDHVVLVCFKNDWILGALNFAPNIPVCVVMPQDERFQRELVDKGATSFMYHSNDLYDHDLHKRVLRELRDAAAKPAPHTHATAV